MADKKKIVAQVNEQLHRAVKMKAAREGKTITQVIIDLLREWLRESEQEEDEDG